MRDQLVRDRSTVLRADPPVGALTPFEEQHVLAAVSSGATARLDACSTATGRAELLPEELPSSAEDSLPVPTSEPDPASCLSAWSRLGTTPAQAVAVGGVAASWGEVEHLPAAPPRRSA